METDGWKNLLHEQARHLSRAERLMVAIMVEILDELRAIRLAIETEAVEDNEPDLFQTFNGPRQ